MIVYAVILSTTRSDRYVLGEVLVVNRDGGRELIGRTRALYDDAGAGLVSIETFLTIEPAVYRAQEVMMDDYNDEEVVPA